MSIRKALFIIRYSLFIILMSGKTFAAVNAPSLRCLNVNNSNGNVDIGWVIPPDPFNEFFSYHIFSANNKAGPYTDIATISTYTQNNYTDLGTSATAASKYYYIVTRYGAGGVSVSGPSDTLQTLFLAVNGLFNTAIAGLSWNSLHTPLLASSGKYYIYKEYPAGNWTLRDSTTAQNYSDTNNTVCTLTMINYRIEQKDASGCNSVSNVAGKFFKDDQQPFKPVVQQVSVNLAIGRANISWFPNNATDVTKYYIYKVDKFANNVLIDSVNVPASTYTYNLSIADKESEGYLIAAVDQCTNRSPLSLTHHSIYVTDSINICEGKVFIKWNKYRNWNQGASIYEIWVSQNGGAYTKLQTVPSTDSTYVHSGLVPFATYKYYIKAIEQNGPGISTSNATQPVYNRIPKPPLYLDIESAAVNIADQSVTLTCNIDTTAGTLSYKILRSTDNNSFSVIATLPAAFTSQISYNDKDAKTSENSYYYKITATDSCNNDYKTSAYARTMLLKVVGSTDLTSTLTWNDYEGFNGSINIYRGINNTYTTSPIATVPYGTNTYTDNVSAIFDGDGNFCYYVEAVKNGSTLVTSKSNVSCEAQQPILFVPNAFSPNGDALNDVFKPHSAFIGTKDYALIIYNRWGKPIYESNDPAIGWDGKINGEDSQIGVYAYIVRYTATNGDSFEKKGSFTLIR